MTPVSPLRRACAQLAYLAETLSDRHPEAPAERRAWLAEMRARLGEVEVACPEAFGEVVDPSGTDPLRVDLARSPGRMSAEPTRGTDPLPVECSG